MPFLKFVVPAAVFAAGTYAQSSCSASATTTITNAADASALSSCSTYSGSIAIATGVTDVTIPVSRVTEDLVAVPNGSLTSLSAPDLEQVDGSLSIIGQPDIMSISMPQLTQVDQFTLQALGQNLLNLNFGTPGLTQVTNLTVSDTFLQNFRGIDLMTAGSVNVATNNLLQDLRMQIRNVTGSFAIRGNAAGLNVNLPNLSNAEQLIINDCSSVQVPSLKNVSTGLAFSDNTFQTLSLPELGLIGPGKGGLLIATNSKLTNISAPVLKAVAGGLVVANNTMLSGTIAFPALRGAQNAAFVGTFRDVMMPMINRIQGTLVLQSNKNIQSTCSRFSDGDVVGAKPVRCRSASRDTQGSGTQSGSGSSSTNTNAAGHYSSSPETVFSIFGGLAALFGLFM